MVNINSAFPSKYLKADDADPDLIVTIRKVDMEKVGQGAKQETKPVVYFTGQDKGMVLNKTNARMIAKIAGDDDTDRWPGTKIRIIATEVEFQGDLVMALRVREIKKKSGLAQEHPESVDAPIDDRDIPFALLLPLVLPFLGLLS
jgi:hypothetical protein